MMFLAWYGNEEPPFLTGMALVANEGPRIFQDVFTFFGGLGCGEPELLYVVGVMADLSPYSCGDEEEWTALAEQCTLTARKLRPSSWAFSTPCLGKYFAHMTRVDVIPDVSE